MNFYFIPGKCSGMEKILHAYDYEVIGRCFLVDCC